MPGPLDASLTAMIRSPIRGSAGMRSNSAKPRSTTLFIRKKGVSKSDTNAAVDGASASVLRAKECETAFAGDVTARLFLIFMVIILVFFLVLMSHLPGVLRRLWHCVRKPFRKSCEGSKLPLDAVRSEPAAS